MRGRVGLLLVALCGPLVGLGLAPTPAAAQNGGGCTPCECAVAYCQGNETYWPQVEIDPAEDEPVAGSAWPVTVKLSLTDAQGNEREPNATFDASLTVRYVYAEEMGSSAKTDLSGIALRVDDVRYPGQYDVRPVLPASGEASVWVEAGRGESDRRNVTVDAASPWHPVPTLAGLPTALLAALAALLVCREVPR